MSEKHAIIFTANEAFPLIIPRQKYFFKNNPWGIISENKVYTIFKCWWKKLEFMS